MQILLCYTLLHWSIAIGSHYRQQICDLHLDLLIVLLINRFCFLSVKSISYQMHWSLFTLASPVSVQMIFFWLEVGLLSNVVDEEYSNCWTIVWSSDRSEILLACSIPDLEFNGFIVEREDSWCKLYSESDLVIMVHALFHELSDDAAFSYTSVSYHNELKQIIELGHY